METKKSKVFTKKLIALFLSVLMLCTSFMGVIQAQAVVGTNRWDKSSALGKNWVDWVDLLSDEAAEALLDAADEFLYDLDFTHLLEGTMPMEIDLSTMDGIPVSLNSASRVYIYLGQEPKIGTTGTYYAKGANGKNPSTTTTKPDKHRVWLNAYVQGGGLLGWVSKTIWMEGYADSVDGVIDLIRQLKFEVLDNANIASLFDLRGTLLGDVVGKNLKWDAFTSGTGENYTRTGATSACGYTWRTQNSAKDIIKMVLKFLEDNLYRKDSNDLIYNILNGVLDLGALNGMVGLYVKDDDPTKGILGGLASGDTVKMPNNYQSNGWLLYNVLAGVLANKTDWFKDDTVTVAAASSTSAHGVKYNGNTWNYDTVLMDKLSKELLQKIAVNITYENMIPNPDYDAEDNPNVDKWIHDSSVARYMSGRHTDSSLPGYDAGVRYDPQGNIYLFTYGHGTNDAATEVLTAAKTDNLYAFAMKALKIAWKTALKPTLNLLQINFNGGESYGHGSNFDNVYTNWYMTERTGANGIFDAADAYTTARFDEFCNDTYAAYGATSAEEFSGWVKQTLVYGSRYAKNDKYNWRDVDATRLWNEVRYSPLADKIFGIQTGPLNMYFLQTGASSIEDFMDSYNYNTTTSIPEALNDFLVAATGDLFPNSHVGIQAEDGTFTSVNLPAFATTNNTWNVSTLMNNIYKALEYVAITTDANLLTEYYAKNSINGYGQGGNITNDAQLEQALVAFGIAALKQWSLTEVIHDSDWDTVQDLESAATIALNEYMGYLFPDRDYSSLWEYELGPVLATKEDGTNVQYKYIKVQDSLYNNAILGMARDAVAYVVTAAGVPVTLMNSTRTPWDPYTMGAVAADGVTAYSATDNVSSIWALADSVGVYFAGDTSIKFDTAGTNAAAKGFAIILGLTGQITTSKTVFQNLDTIINKILPVAGELQYVNGAYKGNGNFSSSAFLQDEIIEDVRDFNLTSLVDGVYRITCAAPIKTTAINQVAYYKLLAPLLNAVLGANSSTGSTQNIIPVDSTVADPFDAFLKPATIVTKYGNYCGVVNALINNIYLYFTSTNSTQFYNGVSFLLTTFGLPGRLGEHAIDGVEITVSNPDVYATSAEESIKVKNNSKGLNRYFHNQGDLNASKQYEAGRYWVNVKSVKLQNAAGSDVKSISTTPTSIAPEKAKYFNITQSVSRDTLYKVVVTYDILFDDTLTNGTATTPAASSTVRYADQTATKWIYVTPTSYTQTWKNQADVTFDGQDFGTKDGAYTGQVVTGTAAQSLQLVAGQMYDVSAANVAEAGYGVRITNSATSDVTGKFYVYPSTGMAYNLRANDSASTVAATAAPTMAFLAIDEKGNIYNKDGGVYGKYDDLKGTATWIMGYHKTTNLEGEEIYDYILANAMSTPAEVAFGAPGAGTVITDCTSLDKSADKNIKLFASGATQPAKYTVGFAFAKNATARAVVTPITLAYLGDMDSLTWAVEHYTDVLGASNAAVQAGAKAASIRYRNSSNVDNWVNADALAKAIYDAGEGAATTRAETINAMNADRDGLEQVDYKVIGFEKFVDYAQKAENLRESKPILDENDQPVLDSKGRQTYTYKTAEPTWKVAEYTRIAGLYKSYMEARPHVLDRVTEELAHATTVCDDYDFLPETGGYTVNDFTATPATAERTYKVEATTATGTKYITTETGSVDQYRFTYSSKDMTIADDVKVYEISSSLADGTAVKFGAIEDGKLVNNGEVKFTTDSWNAYVDALGEVITSINAGEEISKTYTATSHLVMAENELEPIDEPVSDNITVSGRVLIASDEVGTATNFGLRGVVVYAVDGDNNVVAETVSNADGEKSTWGNFTLEVPAGTTQFYVGSYTGKDTIVNRGFTIAGDADVTGANVAVVCCDYNDDGGVNVTDKTLFTQILKGNYSVYGDFNNDGGVNVTDKTGFTKILKGANGKRIVYDEDLVF